MKTLFLLLGLSSSFFLTSCSKGGDGEEGSFFCTADLRIISVEIESRSSHSLSFDEIYTIRQSTGEKIVYTENMTMPGNRFWVLTDQYQPKLRNNSDRFTFIGMRGGQKVFEETYEIYADNCHIGKRTGKDKIFVD